MSKLRTLVEAAREDLIHFAQDLVRIPSLSGDEAVVAARVAQEMERLGYHKVWTDEVGNVVGRIQGGDGPVTLLNGHLDIDDAGDPAARRHPPYAGQVHARALWGRGAADMKGAVAAMVVAGGLLARRPEPLPGDLLVAAVVMEEVAGLGTRRLLESLRADRAVVGEASQNQLMRGHRGRVGLVLHLSGRSVHASMPHLGVNPHYSAARFLDHLARIRLPDDPVYGHSTVAPTRILSAPQSSNVTPSDLWLHLDWRSVPAEQPDDIVARLEAMLARSLLSGCQGEVAIHTRKRTTYTGIPASYPDLMPGYDLPAEHSWTVLAQSALAESLARPVDLGVWAFATDGGHLMQAGIPTVGFGPGEPGVVHTVEERVSLDQLVESVAGYMALALA